MIIKNINMSNNLYLSAASKIIIDYDKIINMVYDDEGYDRCYLLDGVKNIMDGKEVATDNRKLSRALGVCINFIFHSIYSYENIKISFSQYNRHTCFSVKKKGSEISKIINIKYYPILLQNENIVKYILDELDNEEKKDKNSMKKSIINHNNIIKLATHINITSSDKYDYNIKKDLITCKKNEAKFLTLSKPLIHPKKRLIVLFNKENELINGDIKEHLEKDCTSVKRKLEEDENIKSKKVITEYSKENYEKELIKKENEMKEKYEQEIEKYKSKLEEKEKEIEKYKSKLEEIEK